MFRPARLLNFRSHLQRSGAKSISSSSSSKRVQSRMMPRLTLVGGTTLAVLVWTTSGDTMCAPAETESGDESSVGKSGGPGDEVERIIDTFAGPIMQKLGFGGAMGFCSGMLFKKVGEIACYGVGVVFIGLQVLQYQGYINIDFLAVQQQIIETLDADGDGKFDTKDLKIYWRKLKDVLEHGLPSASSFGGGFALALYYA